MTHTHITAPTLFIEVSGTKYAYRRFGAESGIPIVLFQHFRGGLDNWDPAVTDGLSKDRPVILFNYGGVASSGGKTARTFSGMAEQAIAFIRALGLKQVDLLGFSIGGFVAQEVTLQAPDLIRRLILAGTGPEGGESMLDYPPEVGRHATEPVPVVENFLYLFFAASETSQAAGRAFWERRHRRVDQDPPSSPAAMDAQLNALREWGTVRETGRYAKLKRIRQPVLVVNGQDDRMVPTINSFILQQKISDATLVLYPNSGHGAIFQYAEQFLTQARLFLDK